MRTTECDCGHVKYSHPLEVASRNLRSTDPVGSIRESLHELFEEWLCSEAASDISIRSTMISHVRAIDNLLAIADRNEVVR